MTNKRHRYWQRLFRRSLPVFLCLFGGCEKNGDAPGIRAIFRQSFEDDSAGTYTPATLNADWNSPAWSRGVREGRVIIVRGATGRSGKAMQVSYPRGGVGLGGGGASWPLAVGGHHTMLMCSYRLRFASGFNFVRGGKLPGLAGGAANDGGHKPNGSDGWSARLMWHSGGRLSAYVYHPDQPTRYGEHFYFSRSVSAGRWHRVTMRIRMNTPGVHDGRIECWLDGAKALDIDNLRFRDSPSLGVDQFFFSTFFGGNDPSWASARDETITFDDFIVGD